MIMIIFFVCWYCMSNADHTDSLGTCMYDLTCKLASLKVAKDLDLFGINSCQGLYEEIDQPPTKKKLL